ncbi:MAG: hypothetical protein H8D67_15710 [Deltaproteobacteria bacterium]|nr:hypothetical protein [Deltaproteobacteria bacterium]
MLRRKDDFTYSPGILAKKMGVNISTVKKHLKDTGLIKQCHQDDNGGWRVPQSVALKFCSAETLAIPLKHKKKKGRKKIDDTPDADFQDIISELGMSAYEEAPKRRPPKAQTRAEKQHAKMLELMRLAGLSTNDVLAIIGVDTGYM